MQSKVGECLTINGKQCSLPFRFNGISYDACAPHMNGEAWCSIHTDENSNHINGQDTWEYCDPSCSVLTSSSTESSSDEVDSFSDRQVTFQEENEAWKGNSY